MATKQRALAALCDLAHCPETVKQALDAGGTYGCAFAAMDAAICRAQSGAGIGASLRDLVVAKDPDVTVRAKTTEALSLFASHAAGRKALVALHLIGPLAALVRDAMVMRGK